jgi:hypothetical protein
VDLAAKVAMGEMAQQVQVAHRRRAFLDAIANGRVNRKDHSAQRLLFRLLL